MISKNMYLGLKKIGNKLHSKYVYESSSKEKLKWLHLIKPLIENFSQEEFKKLSFDEESQKSIDYYLSLKQEKDWETITKKFLKGIELIIKRELEQSQKINILKNIKVLFEKKLKTNKYYYEKDKIKIENLGENYYLVDYICMSKSPEYNTDFKLWRDTQFKFKINFNTGLFIWDYINVYKDFRGLGIGSYFVKFCEEFALDFNIKRFSVEWPNRDFWSKKGYIIPLEYKIGTNLEGYTIEGYKEK